MGGNLIIEKVGGKKIIIPVNTIEGFIEIENFNKLRPVRSMGNDGLFGYYGIFTTKEYGNINCQLTRLKNILITKSKIGFFAISPEKPEVLIDSLKSTTGASRIKESEGIEPVKRRTNFLILLIPHTIFIFTIIMTVLLYQQLPDRIATHFDFLGNPDGWSSKIHFIYLTIFPQIILFTINIIVFFTTKNRYRNQGAVYFLVIIVSLIQIFVAYTSFDIYWFNIHNTHLVPMFYALAGFVVLLLILFYFYNKFLTKKSQLCRMNFFLTLIFILYFKIQQILIIQ